MNSTIKLSMATLVITYTVIITLWNSAQAEMMKEDEIELSNVYITQTEKQIPVYEAAPEEPIEVMKICDLDLSKITRAIATAETGNGRTGSGRDYNNICGLMYRYYDNGVRQRTYYKYDTYLDGFNACSKVIMTSPSWQDKKYKDMTISEMAHQWSGGDRVNDWIENVTDSYKSQL